MHTKAIVRQHHWHLHGLDAVFPIATDDPTGETLGQLDLGDRLLHEVAVVPERTFMSIDAEEAKDYYPDACAALDYKAGVVYTFSGACAHNDLAAFFGISLGSEQKRVEDDLICGFVTVSGHFLNRVSMKHFVNKYHAELLKPSKDEYFFNSSMVNWQLVMKRIDQRLAA